MWITVDTTVTMNTITAASESARIAQLTSMAPESIQVNSSIVCGFWPTTTFQNMYPAAADARTMAPHVTHWAALSMRFGVFVSAGRAKARMPAMKAPNSGRKTARVSIIASVP
jgi:hypothetical protein